MRSKPRLSKKKRASRSHGPMIACACARARVADRDVSRE